VHLRAHRCGRPDPNEPHPESYLGYQHETPIWPMRRWSRTDGPYHARRPSGRRIRYGVTGPSAASLDGRNRGHAPTCLPSQRRLPVLGGRGRSRLLNGKPTGRSRRWRARLYQLVGSPRASRRALLGRVARVQATISPSARPDPPGDRRPAVDAGHYDVMRPEPGRPVDGPGWGCD